MVFTNCHRVLNQCLCVNQHKVIAFFTVFFLGCIKIEQKLAKTSKKRKTVKSSNKVYLLVKICINICFENVLFSKNQQHLKIEINDLDLFSDLWKAFWKLKKKNLLIWLVGFVAGEQPFTYVGQNLTQKLDKQKELNIGAVSLM